MIDEVSDADLRGEMIENSFAFMRSLYDLAWRRAMQVDQAINDILSKLGDEEADQ
jgi:hypothetical protein